MPCAVEHFTYRGLLFCQTQTDAEGNFRLRGMQPGKQYTIKVKLEGDQRIERASPSTGYQAVLPAVLDHILSILLCYSLTNHLIYWCLALQAGELKDIFNMDFLVFRRLPKLDLTGEVTAEPHVLSTLKVR